ncbi:co-regulatory protein PtrA N-terminal domain-containing protein [Pseudomonas sp. sp1636]|uniref:co-regulatory protein PtrA N-terminal domain-containing protein n=1 Tax=Pseudomonas sp. sp1636 TaxID=3036707 RepID=UPI0025A4D88F|nr:co-regulatory protein PtrA N-terminal domain-containing protein [Pseudomonas sp. sp1636]MDM8351155.1 co-regulatory protein PtrA N-terminal domain-containing protein [Pseudomonas sp. sp1636]
MNSMKALIVIATLTLSSLAMAEGGADRTFARMEQAGKVAYPLAQQQKAESPMADSKTQMADHANC